MGLGIIEAIFITIIVAALIIAIIYWLGPMVGIPGNILNLLKILVVVLALFKLIMLLLGAF